MPQEEAQHLPGLVKAALPDDERNQKAVSNVSKGERAHLDAFFSEDGEHNSLTLEQQALFSRWSSLANKQKQLCDLMSTM